MIFLFLLLSLLLLAIIINYYITITIIRFLSWFCAIPMSILYERRHKGSS